MDVVRIVKKIAQKILNMQSVTREGLSAEAESMISVIGWAEHPKMGQMLGRDFR